MNITPPDTHPRDMTVAALCGGVGGAKLALGLYHALLPDRLTVVVNTGDDFEHLGLHISPDIDTVTYTLGERNNPYMGWGRQDETFGFMDALVELGGEAWFSLGDKDLATHVERTRRLRAGQTLSNVTQDFAAAYGIAAKLMPMSDAPAATMIATTDGVFPFQDYFVRQHCDPVVEAILHEQALSAPPAPGVIEALTHPDLDVIIICPSNPYLSVDPILSVPGIRAALEQATAPVIAISPLIGGAAVKGPTAKIMQEMSLDPTAVTVARHYDGLIDGYVLDHRDSGAEADIPVATIVTNTLMTTLDDKVTLAEDVLDFAQALADRSQMADRLESRA